MLGSMMSGGMGGGYGGVSAHTTRPRDVSGLTKNSNRTPTRTDTKTGQITMEVVMTAVVESKLPHICRPDELAPDENTLWKGYSDIGNVSEYTIK